MTSDIVILDLDETLVRRDGSHDDLAALRTLREMGVELCLASRNDLYHAEDVLQSLQVRELFSLVMADFRPKWIQVRHILTHYETRGLSIGRVVFVDDYGPNVMEVRRHLPDVIALQYGVDIRELSEILEQIRSD